MAETQGMQPEAAAGRSKSFSSIINLLGAATSLALVIGVGVWGYKLVVRDVSGVPLVRAAEGPMRVAPKNPGGRQAAHQGLSVNDVAAEGAASKPADRLILAPEPLDLTLADTQVPVPDDSRDAERGEPAVQDDEAMRFASVRALADDLAEGATPFEEAPAAEPEAGSGEAAQEAGADTRETAVEDGLARSLRPKLRPEGLRTTPEEVALASVANAAAREVDPETIPVGTRLAQLGAFASREIAVEEWDRLADRFDEYLADKDRVIQKASSGGRTFYRLRALGFEDLSDARRFCSALVAERAECIPVVTR